MQIVSEELFWLVCTIILTSLLWMPYITGLIFQMKLGPALWDPYHETQLEKAWAQRAKRAHTNAVENLVIFAPLVIMIYVTKINSSVSATACEIFFFARLAHYIVYTLAFPVIRTLLFAVGVGCQLTLAFELLKYLAPGLI